MGDNAAQKWISLKYYRRKLCQFRGRGGNRACRRSFFTSTQTDASPLIRINFSSNFILDFHYRSFLDQSLHTHIVDRSTSRTRFGVFVFSMEKSTRRVNFYSEWTRETLHELLNVNLRSRLWLPRHCLAALDDCNQELPLQRPEFTNIRQAIVFDCSTASPTSERNLAWKNPKI